MQDHLKKLEDEVSTWPNVSVHPHRFGGHEFLFDKAEVGHMHTGGIVDLLSHAHFVMRSWQMVSLRSITGFLTQGGSLFISATKKT